MTANAEIVGSDETVEMAEPRRGSNGTPEGLIVVKRVTGKREKRRADRVDGGAEITARESSKSYAARKLFVEKLNSIKEKLKRWRSLNRAKW